LTIGLAAALGLAACQQAADIAKNLDPKLTADVEKLRAGK
jgi:hypothetical protein